MIDPVRLGRIGGVPVAVDWSWSIISILMAAAFYVRVTPTEGSRWIAATVAVLGALLLVASVLVHEISHAVAARRRGIGVRAVTLFVFGGYTEMEREPACPRDEFLIAGAGPAASFLLGMVLWGVGAVLGGVAGEVLVLLAGINVAVAVFNLLPGLPLDGGRLLRALIWRGTGDGDRAVRVAADAGRLLGAVTMASGPVVAGLGEVVAGVFGVAVGWFLYRSAAAIRRTAGPLATPIAEVMLPVSGWVPPEAGRAELAEPPVAVVVGDRVVGTVAAEPAEGESAGSAMTPLRRGDLVAASTPIGAAVGSLRLRRRPLVVVDEGRMVGLVPVEHARRWLAGIG